MENITYARRHFTWSVDTSAGLVIDIKDEAGNTTIGWQQKGGVFALHVCID